MVGTAVHGAIQFLDLTHYGEECCHWSTDQMFQTSARLVD